MEKLKKQFIKRTFTLTQEDLEMIEHIYEFGNFASKSEVIRHCLRNNGIAEYKLRSKKKEIENDRIAKMTNEEYALDEFSDLDITITDGELRFNRPGYASKYSIALDKVKNFSRSDISFPFDIKEPSQE